MMLLQEIGAVLAHHVPLLAPPEERRRAAVALILRNGTAGPEILFIERATHAGDPWSGDIGFPGGKVEEGDATPQQAAEREVEEEIGLRLARTDLLGRIDDTLGAHMPVHVACFVYGIADSGPLSPSAEVREFFWVPLEELEATERQITGMVTFRGETFERPAIILPGSGKPVLWGITYRLIRGFLHVLRGERTAAEP
jgi:8-oxo-dGTP pyrophosphatase MutT (NUDIX family)